MPSQHEYGSTVSSSSGTASNLESQLSADDQEEHEAQIGSYAHTHGKRAARLSRGVENNPVALAAQSASDSFASGVRGIGHAAYTAAASVYSTASSVVSGVANYALGTQDDQNQERLPNYEHRSTSNESHNDSNGPFGSNIAPRDDSWLEADGKTDQGSSGIHGGGGGGHYPGCEYADEEDNRYEGYEGVQHSYTRSTDRISGLGIAPPSSGAIVYKQRRS
ncbi:uncharacterized protein I303_105679 [Kwoniella dejecticola CBS 10117]|uniref:Uncharacterized protein n=1 Tax=Kwoniella dejecticola CBS 10117 TaxID=1296121 RepID=A0A1A6A040_9TREE|nr:uncharacterized protein I303_05701 [Kwoniella dejecticola CBS 10117]OBR83423.1 hypothetical protein I303_05701 [Kwoniella dejecticola CBS 10117]